MTSPRHSFNDEPLMSLGSIPHDSEDDIKRIRQLVEAMAKPGGPRRWCEGFRDEKVIILFLLIMGQLLIMLLNAVILDAVSKVSCVCNE